MDDTTHVIARNEAILDKQSRPAMSAMSVLYRTGQQDKFDLNAEDCFVADRSSSQ